MLPATVPSLSRMLCCGCNTVRQHVFMFLLLFPRLTTFITPGHRKKCPEKETSRDVLRFKSKMSSVGPCSSLEEGMVLGGCGAYWKLGLPVGLRRFITWLDSSHSPSPMIWIGRAPTTALPKPRTPLCPPRHDRPSTLNPELVSNFPTWHVSCQVLLSQWCKGNLERKPGRSSGKGAEMTHETGMGRGGGWAGISWLALRVWHVLLRTNTLQPPGNWEQLPECT